MVLVPSSLSQDTNSNYVKAIQEMDGGGGGGCVGYLRYHGGYLVSGCGGCAILN